MKWEVSFYTTPNTLELLPFIMINRITTKNAYAWCIMIGWLTFVLDIQISNKFGNQNKN